LAHSAGSGRGFIVLPMDQDTETTLWLVRHGESTANARGIVQGHDDLPDLTLRGRLQAQRLVGILRHRSVDALYSSDLRRALRTANVLSNPLGLPAGTDSALRERCFGVFEGGPLSALRPQVTGIRQGRVEDVHARPLGGESLDDVYRRAGEFVGWLHLHEVGRNIVVVTHGGTLRAIRAYCAGRTINELAWDHVPNGSVWRIRIQPDRNYELQKNQLQSGGSR
jgi:2,3-bisphosphoglycerate-dependent phosphoglycerate mutase